MAVRWVVDRCGVWWEVCVRWVCVVGGGEAVGGQRGGWGGAGGGHLGCIWGASGEHIGGIWGASGTPGGHGVSGGPWKQLLQYLSAKMQKFL